MSHKCDKHRKECVESQSWSIVSYETVDGVCPYIEWYETLSRRIQVRIDVRLTRVSKGNFGDCKSLSDGIYELRFHFEGGYRIYYGISGKRVVLLLMGGGKKNQSKDIKTARRYWKNYQEEQTRG